MRASRLLALSAVLLMLASGAGPVSAQAPIKVGDINTYSGIGAPFTGPYRAGVEMAVEEINAKGGVLGRKLEVIFRDDKGQPAEAVKHAQELVEQVDAVTPERVRAVAEQVARSALPSIAVVGAGRRSAEYASAAARRLES